MVKRGSITVFLALTLGLILSLLSSGLESARMAAARTQILNGMDIGLYSLFGQYNKSLLKDFDLFAVDGACGGKEMNLASVYDNLESYMKPVMKQNSQKLSVQQGGISGYLLMTDSEGEVFYQYKDCDHKFLGKGPGTMDHFSGKNISHGQNQYQQGRHYQNTIFYCCYCIHDFFEDFHDLSSS